MKAISIIDDKGLVPQTTVRLTCECGWMDKAFRSKALDVCGTHFRKHHGGNGLILYKGEARTVVNGISSKGSLER